MLRMRTQIKNIMTIVLKYVVKCEVLGLDESFEGSYFCHVFSKTCQNAIIDEKNYRNFKFVLIKST
jgi:hypothetical protein